MNKQNRKLVRKLGIAVPAAGVALYFAPLITLGYFALGLLDVLRNDRKNVKLFTGYFTGNGMFTWLLSPFNLFVDLLSYRNRGVWKLEQFPPAWKAEVDEVLDAFRARRDEIIAEIDSQFEEGRRGMYVYQWFGKQHIGNVPEFSKRRKYIKTIAVSVFSGRESTSFHFGPLRLTLRVLYNLKPAQTDRVFIECGNAKSLWYRDPLFIFDDTLLHRSVNEYDARRYCVFMDIVRPSPVPAFLSAMLTVVSFSVDRINRVFYKNWKMIGTRKPAAAVAPAR